MNHVLTLRQRCLKRTFDLVLASLGLALTGWLILLAWAAASLDTRQNGLFQQVRIGRWGHPFTVLKIRTMRQVPGLDSTVTTAMDIRITPLGRWLRQTKLDELPQLVNVFLGQMSFVGPRPDVPGFADKLSGRDRLVLSLRPGITGPATLVFRNEEELLAAKPSPETYNREVIYPKKVALNLEYLQGWNLRRDLAYIMQTALGKNLGSSENRRCAP